LTLGRTPIRLAAQNVIEKRGAAVKTYHSPRAIVAEIKRLMAADKPSPRPPSALARVAKALCEGRHYLAAGIFLTIDGREILRAFSGPQGAASPQGAGFAVPIKIGSHTLGSLRVQLAPGRAASFQERVLLHKVAEMLALYLTGKGKFLVRKAREALRETAPATAEKKPIQPPAVNQRDAEVLYAAAGEKSIR
jgi:hypothetical protein